VLSILTSVDLDHQQDLGATIEQIAKDKAGIAPPGGTLVVGAAVSDAAREVVLRECSERNVRCVETSCSPLLAPSRESLQTQLLELKGDEGKFQVLLPFPGQHQALNLLTVAAAVRQLHALGLLSAFESITGVAHARMAGRFEFIPGRPAWLLDVAHNPASIRALIATVDALGVTPRVRVVVGASERHDHAAMISMLTAWGVPLTFCDGFPRAVSATQLAKESGRAAHVFTSPDDAIDHGFSQTEDSDGIILITGSLFLVGACRRRLIQRGVLSNP
jgi:folylpolyglutamate synthase/dihydropteroate synthase